MLNLRRSWDPLYGRIEIDDFEFDLISLPEVQRLRYVRMCNINSLLVAGASEISRFEHTLGVMHLAKLWVRTNGLPESQGKDIVAAAVLHDMQTGPFGHSMQYVFEDNEMDVEFIHEDISHGWRSAYHQKTLANSSFSGKPFGAQLLLKERMEVVAAIIRGEGTYGPLIAGTMDLDNIDNVIRLAFHAGFANDEDKKIPLSLAQNISISNGEIVINNGCISAVSRWQEIRTCLYTFLLHDWAEFSAKGMLTKAIEIAMRHEMIGADSWLMTDDGFLDFLEEKGIGETQDVRELIRRLKRGDLYTPIALYESPDVDLYSMLSEKDFKASLEAELSRGLKGRGVKPLVHFILDNRKTERAISFRLSDTGEHITMGSNSCRLLSGVFVSNSKIADAERNLLADKFRGFLIGYGATNINLIVDPMGEFPSNPQLTLI